MPDPRPEPRPPTRLALALEDLLAGKAVPVLALVVAAATAALYLAGVLPEGATAGVAIVLVAALAALLMVRHAIAGRDRAGRALALVAAAATAALVALPGLATVLPGAPLAEGSLGQVGDAMPLGPGVAGAVRVLVHAPLPPEGAPRVRFRILGAAAPIEGVVERTLSPARVGRSGRTMVAHDRSSEWLEARVAAGAPALRLDLLSGETAGPLAVEVFHDPLPGRWVWLLSAAALALAAAADARLGGKDHAGAIAGIALVFGILVVENATPDGAVPTVLGGILLGAIGGAAAGWLAGLLARRVVPAPAATARPSKAAAPERRAS